MNLYRWRNDRQSCKNCAHALMAYDYVVLCQYDEGILGTVDTWCGQWKQMPTTTWHGDKQMNKKKEK